MIQNTLWKVISAAGLDIWGEEKERIKDESSVQGHLPKVEMAGKGKAFFVYVCGWGGPEIQLGTC